MKNVLLLEDSDEYQLVVRRALADMDINLKVLNSCQEVRDAIQQHNINFDLLILDLSLPDGDGFTSLQDLRTAGLSVDTPFFFLTSQADLDSKVTAFNLGADDYLVKPVSPIELRARVEMRLRKRQSSLSEPFKKGDLVVDQKGMKAFHIVDKKQEEISLTLKEFKILSLLIQNENKVFTRVELVQVIWGADVHILDRTIDSHIYGLRKKMGTIGHYIESIPGSGYRFNLANQKAVGA